MPYAVTIDIVGSRSLHDRPAAQRAIDDALEFVDQDVPPLTAVRPTVGDELQGVYADLDDALAATLILRLALPDDVDCRFGLGAGDAGRVPSRRASEPELGISEGSAWWAARRAIERAHALPASGVAGGRSWYEGPGAASVNAYLLTRDQIVSTMTGRARRLALGAWRGERQADLARREGVSQSAVSQMLGRSGGASLVAGLHLLRSGSSVDRDA